ncbi:hypothetical protein HK101_007348 [Irineochytrium annulatum]|nr:hypothetical protein HK101_007348 [Irineochytrium annulatum]
MNDGIIGMSLTPTFAVNPLLFTSLIAANAVSAPQMSYSLNPSDASGEIVFGGYDTTLFADPAAPLLFSTVAPSSLGSFALALSSITTDSTLIPNVTTTFSAAAIIDTGTSFATVPTNILTPLAAAVNATFSPTYGVYIAPCSSQDVNAGPILSYNFASGVTVYATAAEYVIHPPAAVGLQGCILALTPINDASSTFYVGNTVLKRWVTVFDYANGGRVGFALAKGRAIKGAVATTTTMTATTALATAPATSVSVMPPALPTASATNPAAATAAAQSGSTGSSGTPLVAVILAPLLIVLALALAIFLCIRYRRRQPSSFATFKRRGSDDVFASAGLMEGRVVYIGDAESPAAGKQDVGGAVRIDGTKRMNEYDVGAAGGGGVLAVAASAGNTPEPLAPVRRDSAGAPLLVNTEAPASQPALDGVRSEAIVAPPRGDSAKSPLPEPEVETSVQVAGGETTAVLSPGLTEPMSAATEPMGSSSLVLGPLGIVEEEEKVDKVQ